MVDMNESENCLSESQHNEAIEGLIERPFPGYLQLTQRDGRKENGWLLHNTWWSPQGKEVGEKTGPCRLSVTGLGMRLDKVCWYAKKKKTVKHWGFCLLLCIVNLNTGPQGLVVLRTERIFRYIQYCYVTLINLLLLKTIEWINILTPCL